MRDSVEIKAPSEIYGITDCVIDVDSFLKGRRVFPCGDGSDYKLRPSDVIIVDQLIKNLNK